MRWEFSISVALVVVVFSYGVRALIKNDPGPTIPLRVTLLQPNIPQREKFDPEAEEKVLETYDRLTALATLGQPAPQLVIWPESATPRALFADEDILGFVKKQAARGDFGLLFGSTDFDPARGETGIAALFTNRGEQLRFTEDAPSFLREYLPLRPLLAPIAGDLIPGDFTAGADYRCSPHNPTVRIAHSSASKTRSATSRGDSWPAARSFS